MLHIDCFRKIYTDKLLQCNYNVGAIIVAGLWLGMIENHKKLPPTLATTDAATDAVAAAAADARAVVAVAS